MLDDEETDTYTYGSTSLVNKSRPRKDEVVTFRVAEDKDTHSQRAIVVKGKVNYSTVAYIDTKASVYFRPQPIGLGPIDNGCSSVSLSVIFFCKDHKSRTERP